MGSGSEMARPGRFSSRESGSFSRPVLTRFSCGEAGHRAVDCKGR